MWFTYPSSVFLDVWYLLPMHWIVGAAIKIQSSAGKARQTIPICKILMTECTRVRKIVAGCTNELSKKDRTDVHFVVAHCCRCLQYT